MFGVDLSDIDIDGRDPNGNYPGDYDGYMPRESFADSYDPPSPKYEFYSYEALVTSKVFQEALSKSLAHKDREIESLRNELLALSSQ